MNLLHLVADEKFIPFSARAFGALKGVSNRYLLRGAGPVQHVAQLPVWRRVGWAYLGSYAHRRDLQWADCVVVHYLDPLGAGLVSEAPGRVVVAWSGWGADYYRLLPGGERALLEPQTEELLARSPTAWQRTRRVGRTVKEAVADAALVRSALARFDLFSSPLANEYPLLAQALGPTFRAEFAQLNYGAVEGRSAQETPAPRTNDVLVGNSATPSNNHLDAFAVLAKGVSRTARLVVPLSYGDEDYRQQVLRLGRELFAERFVPLLDFAPLADYQRHVAGCSVGVMYHRRQQGLGNVLLLMEAGAKVLLNDKSPLYAFLREAGAHVFPLRPEECSKPLTPEAVAENRRVLRDTWGIEAVLENHRRFVERVGQRAVVG